MEIERKWLLKGLPENPHICHEYIKQTYLASYNDCEVRVRAVIPASDHHGEDISPYKFTYKSGGQLSRFEIEKELTEYQYNTAINLVNKPAIFKDFYTYFIDYYKIEISEVDNSWFYAEVEFDSEKEAINYQFPWPELIIRDVTYEDEYKMKNYWKRTRLNEKLP